MVPSTLLEKEDEYSRPTDHGTAKMGKEQIQEHPSINIITWCIYDGDYGFIRHRKMRHEETDIRSREICIINTLVLPHLYFVSFANLEKR